ncbi:MAG: hypothetical protein ACXVQ3_09730 [Gaiellaceae bacterium]
MLPELGELTVDQGSRRGGDHDLAAVSACSDARSPMELSTSVTLAGEARLAGVETHPHLDRTRSKPRLAGGGRTDRITRLSESEEEGVSLRVDLNSAAG